MSPLINIIYTYLLLQEFYKFFAWNQRQKPSIFFIMSQIIALKI